jgi:hypothetical protein
MGKSKVTAIGKITAIEAIKAEGLIFQGEGTRLISRLYYNKDNYYLSYYSVIYQVKSDGRYFDLFSIHYSRGRSTYLIKLKPGKNRVNDVMSIKEEQILTKLKKSDISKKPSVYQATNPVQFCTIPFLEDEVKNWILTAGQQTYSEKDFKALAKSLIS